MDNETPPPTPYLDNQITADFARIKGSNYKRLQLAFNKTHEDRSWSEIINKILDVFLYQRFTEHIPVQICLQHYCLVYHTQPSWCRGKYGYKTLLKKHVPRRILS